MNTNVLKHIDSKANPLIRVLSNLTTTKGRRDAGQILIESLHPVEEALGAQLSITHLLLRADKADSVYAYLAERYENQLDRVNEIMCVSEDAMLRVASTKSAPEVIAIAECPQISQSLPQNTSAIGLYQLQDPGNVGTLIRSALAFGLKHVAFIGEQSVDIYQPKIIRASAGLIFRAQLIQVDSIDNIPQDTPTIGFDANAETSLYNFSWPNPCVILLGSEGPGLPSYQPPSMQTLRIETETAVESLNVAIAGSIVLQHRYSQLTAK